MNQSLLYEDCKVQWRLGKLMETMYWWGTRSSRNIGDMEERGPTDNKSREIPGKKLENQFIHTNARETSKKKKARSCGMPF